MDTDWYEIGCNKCKQYEKQIEDLQKELLFSRICMFKKPIFLNQAYLNRKARLQIQKEEQKPIPS